MMRSAILTALFIIGIASSAFAAGETVMINHPKAKIRNGPATGYSILWKPRMYTPMEVLTTWKDEKGAKWYIVRDVEGDVGWTHYSGVAESVGAIVITKITSVRKEPNATAQELYKAPRNYTFSVIDSKAGWYKVKDPDGETGWVKNPDVWTGRTPRVKKEK